MVAIFGFLIYLRAFLWFVLGIASFASPSLVPRTPVILHGGAQRARRDPPPTSDSESPSSDLPAPTPALRLRLVPTIRLRLLLAPSPPGSDHLTPSPSGLRLLDSFSLWLNHSAAAPPPSPRPKHGLAPHRTLAHALDSVSIIK